MTGPAPDRSAAPTDAGRLAARPLVPGVWWGTTTRADGDLRIDVDPAELAARRAALVDLPWLWLRQVHGADVVTVGDAAEVGALAGTRADASVTAVPGVVLAVHTADCAPVVLAAANGVIGAAHAGWRGLEAGVVEATVAAMRAAGADGPLTAALGPCVGPECYEFGEAELAGLVERWGPAVRGTTRAGTPALDVPAAVAAALAAAGVAELDTTAAACTACGADRWFSHRARAEAGRLATVVWREER